MDDNKEKNLKGLVVGGGSIGSRHLRNLSALGVTDLALVEPIAQRRKDLRREIDLVECQNLEQGLSWEPDFVVIATPTNMHAAQALDVASNGFHIFVEKPLSHTSEHLTELADEVKRQNLITLVGCNMRFHPGLMMVKKMIDENAIGNIVSARVEVGQYLPDWHPNEDYRLSYSANISMGGGIILDAIHEIDYIQWLLGDVETVFCFAGKLSHLEIDTNDTAALLLRFKSGAIGEVHLDYVQRIYSRSNHIIGDEGTIRWNYSNGETRWFSIKTKQWQVINNPPGWQPNQMYLDEMHHFLRCLEEKSEPTLDVFRGKQVLEIALAAKSSATTGRIKNI